MAATRQDLATDFADFADFADWNGVSQTSERRHFVASFVGHFVESERGSMRVE